MATIGPAASTASLGGPVGPQGTAGGQGAQGTAGNQGAQGAQGAAGGLPANIVAGVTYHLNIASHTPAQWLAGISVGANLVAGSTVLDARWYVTASPNAAANLGWLGTANTNMLAIASGGAESALLTGASLAGSYAATDVAAADVATVTSLLGASMKSGTSNNGFLRSSPMRVINTGALIVKLDDGAGAQMAATTGTFDLIVITET